MARADEPQGLLRGCPTCGTPVSEAKLGLRDYRWVNDALPGKVGGMDIDFTINQARTGRALMLEFKPEGAYLSTGHRLTFALFVKKGIDVWVIWEQKDGSVKVGPVNKSGHTPVIEHMPIGKLRTLIREWWNEGMEDD